MCLFKGKNCPSCGVTMTWKEEILRADVLYKRATACRNCKSIIIAWYNGYGLEDSGTKVEKLPNLVHSIFRSPEHLAEPIPLLKYGFPVIVLLATLYRIYYIKL